MTIAICKSCGVKKWGAFNQCDSCGFKPKTDNELAESLILSDHYFDEKVLNEMTLKYQSGSPPIIDEDSINMIKEQLHGRGGKMSLNKKKEGFFRRLFGSPKKSITSLNKEAHKLTLNKQISLITENIQGPIILNSHKMSLTLDLEESLQFTFMLLMAKSSGWVGGDDLVEYGVDEENQQLVVFNLHIDGYAHIGSIEALSLAGIFSNILHNGISFDDTTSIDEDINFEDKEFAHRIIMIMESGDVDIEIM